jgi:hypothetical protein
MLRRVYGFKIEEVTGTWIMHNEELDNLNSSSIIITMIKSRRLR